MQNLDEEWGTNFRRRPRRRLPAKEMHETRSFHLSSGVDNAARYSRASVLGPFVGPHPR